MNNEIKVPYSDIRIHGEKNTKYFISWLNESCEMETWENVSENLWRGGDYIAQEKRILASYREHLRSLISGEAVYTHSFRSEHALGKRGDPDFESTFPTGNPRLFVVKYKTLGEEAEYWIE